MIDNTIARIPQASPTGAIGENQGTLQMRSSAESNPELVAGYRLTALIGRGASGEVWRGASAEGAERAVKIVHTKSAQPKSGSGVRRKSQSSQGNGDAAPAAPPAPSSCPTIERVRAIEHPHLVHLDHVEVNGNDWILVMELAEKNLADVHKELSGRNQRGIPRDDLLEYLAEAAEALDLLNFKQGFPHLNVKPSNILSLFNHAKVADAGIVCDLAAIRGFTGDAAPTNGEPLPGITPRYAAPEMFTGRYSRSSDQYSLAILYQELLTGSLPFDGNTVWQMAMQHGTATPNLQALPEGDRGIVAKALSKDPLKRYPSCLMFLMALVTGEVEPQQVPEEKLTAARIIRCLHGGALFQSESTSTADSIADMSETPAMSWAEFTLRANLAAEDEPISPMALPTDLAANEDLPPGYRFIKELTRTPLADVWKIQAPDGANQLAKLVLFRSRNRMAEDRALAELEKMRHPALPIISFVTKQQARLLIGTEMIDDSVRKQFEICHARGDVGIPRAELLEVLGQAAEALDDLHDTTAITHLGLNPSNVLLTPQGVKLGDFGLWHLLGAALPPLTECNLRYCAPELADYQATRACDEFSLAVIYQEMLTGTRPFSDRALRAALGKRDPQVHRAELPAPDLEAVPATDRAILTRALDPIPERRFATCSEFVRALKELAVDDRAEGGTGQRVIVLGNVEVSVDQNFTHPRAVINELFMTTIGKRLIQERRGLRGLVEPGEMLVHRCGASFASGMTRKKLTGFARDYHLKVMRAEDGLVVYHMPLPGASLFAWKKKPTLEIMVSFRKPRASGTRLAEAEMSFKPINCKPEQAGQALREIAPAIMEKLRMYLVADPEYRGHERVPYIEPFTVALVLMRGENAAPIDVVGKDLSLDGMGFMAPAELPRLQYLMLNLQVGEPPRTVMVPARVVRCQDCGHGWHEVGVRFVTNL